MSGAYDCNYDFVDDPLSALVEAHAEIRRLEDEHATESARLRLTDAEREAIYRASQYLSQNDVFEGMVEDAAALRGLLERMGGGR